MRHHYEAYCFHRVLPGMGGSGYGEQGISKKRLITVAGLCCGNSDINWLDLNVPAVNAPVIKLYLKCAFKVIAEISYCYQIDGESVSETARIKSVKS